MNTQTIELDGFDIELASELYCDRGGDHRELVDRARIDRKQLGHNLDAAVLCVRCLKAIPVKA
jgi:NAD-dependent dihydropyrimidine dehydrogenase PreA subunit